MMYQFEDHYYKPYSWEETWLPWAVLLSCFLCVSRTGSFHFRRLVITLVSCNFRDKSPKLIYLLENPPNFSNLSDVNNTSAIFTSVLFFHGYMMNSHELRGRKKNKPMFLQFVYIRRMATLWLVPTLSISLGWQEASQVCSSHVGLNFATYTKCCGKC